MSKAFAARLGMSSPSKVFMEHGENIRAGLVIGMGSGAQAPVPRVRPIEPGGRLVGVLSRLADSFSWSNWTAEAAAIRDRRRIYQDARMPLTYGSVGDTVDASYRLGYQRTA